MTLEKHLIDTMKEWQIKIGSFDSNIRLYYPKVSLCRYLELSQDIADDLLAKSVERYLSEQASELGEVNVSSGQDRFCIMVGKEGCDYVENEVEEPEFLAKFLQVLKSQKMQDILNFFVEYANVNSTSVCKEVEEEAGGLETSLYFENEAVEPYVYCIDENEFGITYHRFAKEDYLDLR